MISKKEEYIKAVYQKDIVLFGAGNYAVCFYKKFKDILNIVQCITNDEREKVFYVDGEEICPISRVEEFEDNEGKLIIVCAENHLSMEEQLRTMGFSYGRDYIDSSFFEVLHSRKKIAVFYGVCYTRAIYMCLQMSENFTSQYCSYYWMEYLKMDAVQEELFSYLLEICDLYIYNAFLTREKRRINNAYLRRLGMHCNSISIPILIFNGYYPCDMVQVGRDNIYNVTSNMTPYAPFLTPDHNINRMMEEGYCLNEIVKRVSDVDFYQKEFVIHNYEKEMKKLELAERTADIHICDFLHENHGRKRTFLNEKHISNVVVMELSNRILDKLELGRDIDVSVLEKRLLYTSEVPVYPSIIKHLSLNIYKGTYTLFTFKGDVKLTFEEYVKKYYEYCTMMKACFEQGYFPFTAN